jgi:hypothetical protein
MKKHELAPAVEPEKEQAQPQKKEHQQRTQWNDPIQIVEEIVSRFVKAVAEIQVVAAMVAAARPVKTVPAFT